MRKNLIKLFTVQIAVALLLVGCIDEPPSVGEPFDRVSDLSGTWNIVKVTQNDEDAISKGFPAFVQTVDLTNRAGFNDYSLVLNTDDSGTPTTFQEVTQDSPPLIGISEGVWSLDDPEVPSEITFTSNDGNSVSIGISTYIGLNEGRLELKLTRFSGGKAILSYVYEFQR